MKKILIAEDSSVIQKVAQTIFNFQKFEVKAAKNGQEVLDLLQKESFDAILMDIHMPVMDGMDCARAIRTLPDARKARIPLVAITGNAKNYTLDQFKAAGFDDCVIKPINFDHLVRVVQKLTAN